MSSPSLLTIPWELRRSILQQILKRADMLELQQPVWANKQDFSSPLFGVCWSLREEALEIFYETNRFLWFVDFEDSQRSDPEQYPSVDLLNASEHAPISVQRRLSPALPWAYPYLMKHIRRIFLHIAIPGSGTVDVLERRFNKIVNILDGGRRLDEFNVLISSRLAGLRLSRFKNMHLIPALEVLAKMKVKGRVELRTRHIGREGKAFLHDLNLDKRMKAE